MKRFLFCLLCAFITQINCFASYVEPTEGDYLIYSKETKSWSISEHQNTESEQDNLICLTKKLEYASGAYSKYVNSNNEESFTLVSDQEILHQGNLISINNNELKFTKISYDTDKFIEINLTDEELQNLFPEYVIIKMSQFEHDKLTLKKKFFETKKILLVNDTDEFYYRPTCMVENVQTSPVRGLVNLYKLGNYEFKHFGEHNGKFLIQVKLDRREHKWFWKK